MLRITASIVALVCIGATCVGQRLSRYPYFLADGPAGAPAQRWLVTSMNLDLELPQHLIDPAESVRGELLEYLKDSGREASAIPFGELRQRLGEALAAASPAGQAPGIGGVEERERALGLLARHLAAEREFDVMLVPNLVIDQTKFAGLNAIWHGVSRRQRVESSPDAKFFANTMEGMTEVLSLHVRIWSAAGEKVFESFGGLDVANVIQLQDDRFAMVPREDLFQEPELLREGIAIALDPYLPMAPESHE